MARNVGFTYVTFELLSGNLPKKLRSVSVSNLRQALFTLLSVQTTRKNLNVPLPF